ncbi:nickel-dependent hydrogenase large subunit [Methylacidimicrobium tartarophylax]|uniref:Hydrogenase, group Ib n=1 Tax=Methylacidimicrobium tartarophylax TaxID=1041768 RepID=A0A5E6M9G2_9BACT|nr:nickel-dependent hydrogenase large subunit [Methylacidimicrobium tartarophylax]VVM04938.1 hydrogenase, group Ib [Methylacidimicrobium tartarophylax]
MSRRIVVDPITRIEGHLRIEAVLDETNLIQDAYASGTMFRGIETILKGRDPRDAGLLAMRICGVCTGVHYWTSIRAVEDAFGVRVPNNARLVRNLIAGSLYLHDHPVHFYHLHALDWVDVISALKADPRKAVDVAYQFTDTPWNVSVEHFRQVQERLNGFAAQGRLGIFAGGYWGNPSYRFSPEENLIAVSHYLDALAMQRGAAKMMAIFGGKNPHPQSIVVGGVTCVQDIENPSRISLFQTLLEEQHRFIRQAYLPDILMAAHAYREEGLAGIGSGLKSYLAYGFFDMDNEGPGRGKTLFPSGMVLAGDLSKVYDFEPSKVTEDVLHSWYRGQDSLHPYAGVTDPAFTGLRKEGEIAYLDSDGKYSWIKAPTYDDHRVETGPLARLLVGYARGDARIREAVDGTLRRGGLPATVLFSTLGRTAARAIETDLVAEAMAGWAQELAKNTATGDLSTWTPFDFAKVSRDAQGCGLSEAPRGALGHWIKIRDGKIENYQAVVPTTWNASPRDRKGRRGAYEEALIGTRLADADQPLEILRTIHSFDPCLACSVHIVDFRGRDLGTYRVL